MLDRTRRYPSTVQRHRPRPAGGRWLLAGAALLGGLAALTSWRVRRAEASNPPSGHFVEIDGVRVHYVEHGAHHRDAVPIVLIHGNGSMVQDFELSGIVAPLAERHRVVLFDRPGSGYTERPRARAWTAQEQADLLVKAAAALGIERPVVVGHSWGTLPALVWALDHPDAVSALVLASGYYYPTKRVDAVTTLPVLTPLLGDLWLWTFAPLIGRLNLSLGNKLIFAPAAPTADWRSGFPFELALRPSQVRATAADTAQMPAEAAKLAGRYGELHLPVYVVVGSGDKLVGPETHSVRLAAEIGAPLIVMAGAGHMIQHLDPQRFVGVVMRAVHHADGSGGAVVLDHDLPGLGSGLDEVEQREV